MLSDTLAQQQQVGSIAQSGLRVKLYNANYNP